MSIWQKNDSKKLHSNFRPDSVKDSFMIQGISRPYKKKPGIKGPKHKKLVCQ